MVGDHAETIRIARHRAAVRLRHLAVEGAGPEVRGASRTMLVVMPPQLAAR